MQMKAFWRVRVQKVGSEANLAGLVSGVFATESEGRSVWPHVMGLCLADWLPELCFRATAIGSSEQGLANTRVFCLIKASREFKD